MIEVHPTKETMSSETPATDFHYAPAVLGLLTPERALEIVSVAQDLISKTSFSKDIHWGEFDVWDDYDKLVLREPSEWDLTYYSGFFGFVRDAGPPLRTPSTGLHYAPGPENSFTLFYDDYEHVNTDDSEWAELLHAIIAAVPEINVVTYEEMNSY